MRRKLDLNGPSIRIVAAIALFLGVIPAALYLITAIGAPAPAIAQALRVAIKVSLAVGALGAAAFAALIVAEQIQDRRFDRWYRKQRRRRLRLAGGRYECQFCGNQDVSLGDTCCRVCGKTLE